MEAQEFSIVPCIEGFPIPIYSLLVVYSPCQQGIYAATCCNVSFINSRYATKFWTRSRGASEIQRVAARLRQMRASRADDPDGRFRPVEFCAHSGTGGTRSVAFTRAEFAGSRIGDE